MHASHLDDDGIPPGALTRAVNVVESGTRAELASHASTPRVSPDAPTLEDLVTLPGPGALNPGAFEFSPDDSILTNLYCPPGTLQRQLYAYDIATGEQTLCATDLDDQTSSGASGTARESAGAPPPSSLGGVSRYSWPTRPDAAPRVLIPHRDGAWVQDFVRDDAARPPPRLVAAPVGDAAVLDPTLSPDGRWLLFVRDDELHVASCEVRTGDPSIAPEATRVTFGARGRPMVTHGLAEYAAAEEMGRDRGAWWSPDGGAVAFARADVSAVPLFEVRRRGAGRGQGGVERHAYPFAGCENACVRLGVVDVSSLTLDRRGGASTGRKPRRRSATSAIGGWIRGEDERDATADPAFVSSHPDTFPLTWMDVECGTRTLGGRGPEEEYLVDVTWTPSGEHVLAQIQSRSQRQLKIVKIDARTGARVAPCPLFVERASRRRRSVGGFRDEASRGTDEEPNAEEDAANVIRIPAAWVNISNVSPRVLTRSRGAIVAAGDVVWASESSGFLHLYLVDGTTGARLRALTAGEWCVERVVGVDETDGWVYFTGTHAGPLETHLYRARLWPRDDADLRGRTQTSPDQPERLTAQPGSHAVVLDHASRRFVDVHSDLNSPPTVTLYDVPRDARVSADRREGPAYQHRVIFGMRTAEAPRPRLEPPSFVTLAAADGVTALHGALYLPDQATRGPPPYPCVVFAYGGPKVQTVTNGWNLTSDVRAQLYRSRGYAVFKLDGRGSARRGLAFENVIAGALGAAELEDQIAGVRWLAARGLIDPARVAIVGWSYGGFLAALAATTEPETFPVAVAGAPVTSWADYDGHYSERYMGDPAEYPEGYAAASVLARVGEKEGGKMMLVHGMLDENVHFRHTARLVAAMERAGKRAGEYALLPFAFERHEPRGWAERMYLERRVLQFVEAALGKGEG